MMSNATLPGRKLEVASLSFALERAQVELEAPLELATGAINMIEGASGVGKSSLARILLGLERTVSPPIEATSQIVLKLNDDAAVVIRDQNGFHEDAREHLGFMPQLGALAFIDDLSPEDNLGIFSRLPKAKLHEEIKRLAERLGIWPLPGSLARASGGQRMRLSAVRALVPRREDGASVALLVADEPTVGLDPALAREVAAMLGEIARGGQTIVVVITHDPSPFLPTGAAPLAAPAAGEIRIRRIASDGASQNVARLKATPRALRAPQLHRFGRRIGDILEAIGGLLLAPLAIVAGLVRMDSLSARTGTRAALRAGLDPGTWLFVSAASLVVGTTLSFFAFERMPRREIAEPLFLEEFLAQFGLVMLIVLPPLFAALFSTAKTGAAQAAQIASAVRSGLLETLAMARIHVETFALLPAVCGQMIALVITTALAMGLGLLAAAVVFLASGSPLSLDLAIDMMLSSLDRAPGWQFWLIARTLTSGIVAGAIAAYFGLRPPRGREEDVAQAVHRTLLWNLLAVLATQCAFIVAEFGVR